MRHRLSDENADYKEYCDRPSEALFALLAHYWIADSLSIIRFDLAELDGTTLGTFVPDSYKCFSERIIPSGSNIYFRIGFEVFTVDECASFFEKHLMVRIDEACKDMDDLDSCIALAAALVFPDRIPWHLIE